MILKFSVTPTTCEQSFQALSELAPCYVLYLALQQRTIVIKPEKSKRVYENVSNVIMSRLTNFIIKGLH